MDFDLDGVKLFFARLMLNLSWGTSARKEFYDLLANFVSDGVPLYEAVEEISKRWEDEKNRKAVVTKTIMNDLRGKSGAALRLGQSIGKFVPPMEAMAIDAGEQAGDIADGLRMAASLSSVSSELRAAILGEMIYPLFLMGLLFTFMIGLKTAILPVFEDLLPRAMWPTGPRMLGNIAEKADVIVMGVTGLIVTIIVSFALSKSRWVGVARDGFDRFVPPWSIHRQVTGAILMTCFSALTKTGFPFSSVIDKLSQTAGDWERSHLDAMRNRMRKGVRDGEAMAGSLFDSDVRWEITVYARLTGFSVALESLSNRIVKRVIKKLTFIASLIRNVIMFTIAGMIVWIYGSFFEITMAAKRAVS